VKLYDNCAAVKYQIRAKYQYRQEFQLCSNRNEMLILQAETESQIAETRTLFREYETWLGLDLCFQGFEEELRGLPGKYAPPDGRLLLAYSGGKLAGCVAMRKLGSGICEMKRLFVRDAFRGRRIGNELIGKIIEEARAAHYRQMRLDTYPEKMGKAADLYRSYGFREIAAYYDNPHEGVLFMELDLADHSPDPYVV
jgi:ribosomal protein S18 acetylase RimI-like enzyme